MPLNVSPSLLREIEELSARSQFKPSDFNLIEDSEHRVRTALNRAYVDRFYELLGSFEAVKTAANYPETEESQAILKAEGERLHRAASDFAELQEWVYPPTEPKTQEQALPFYPSLLQSGWDRATSSQIIGGLQKRSVGAPPKKRLMYVDAFERMLRPRATLGKVMNKLCDCGNKVQHSGCTKKFQAGIGSVKKLLRKYAPELVAEYDKLHPDRARLNRKTHHKSMTR